MKTIIKMNCKSIVTFLAILQIIVSMLALPNLALSSTVVLAWDPATDSDIAGYNVYYQAESSAVPFKGVGAAQGDAPLDVANRLNATVGGLDPDHSYYFAVTAYNSAGLESVYSNIIEVPEALPPTVTISSPSDNASLNGAVSISATASDNKGVTRVEFYLNGALLWTDTAAPYAFPWDTSPLTSGPYTLLAKAFDAAGNVGESEVVVTVAGDTAAPVVSLTAPGASTNVSGSVTITASAADSVGVTKIEIYDNGELAFAGNENPASYNWNSALGVDGSHILSAKAYDAAGNIGRSTDVMVTVQQAVVDTTPPAIVFSAPTLKYVYGSTARIAASATDNVAVTSLELYIDGVLISSTRASSFDASWNLTLGKHVITVKAYDGNNAVSSSLTVNRFF